MSASKILIVANSTWNIYNFRLNLLRSFEQAGLEIVVVAPVDEYIHYLHKAVHIRHINLKHLSRKGIGIRENAKLIKELYGIYRAEKPALVLHFTIKPNIFGSVAAKMAGIKSVSVVTGLGYTFLHAGWIQKITFSLYRLAFKISEKVIFENEDDRELFVDQRLVSQAKTVVVNGCGVDSKWFAPMEKMIENPKTVFAFIGRLLYDKGILEFINASRSLLANGRSIECWVLGELDEGNPSSVRKEQLVRWISDQTIRYYGTTDDVRQYIRNADCIVLPSFREGLPKIILEALSMGKPIITTDTAGCRDTVNDHKNGWLVEAGNAEQLEAAMLKLHILDTDQREIMGLHGQALVHERYRYEIVNRQYGQILEDLRCFGPAIELYHNQDLPQ
ncbi:MAG: glycosyltransferase family 4 protein [Saprospiraceae bacterium]